MSILSKFLLPIILIFIDDSGYGDVGYYGAVKIKTPNIDKLASEGRTFTDAHLASVVYTPSRYGLLTGDYPMRAVSGVDMFATFRCVKESGYTFLGEAVKYLALAQSSMLRENQPW